MELEIVEGDLLDQEVEVIVNAWNRNLIPWWLLIPQGVSGAIKRRAGLAPFRELARFGGMPLGSAVLTGAGRLPFKGIIHVAGINLLWRASEASIRDGTRNAVRIAEREGFASIAFPVLGSGSGGYSEDDALAIMREELERCSHTRKVKIVRFYRKS